MQDKDGPGRNPFVAGLLATVLASVVMVIGVNAGVTGAWLAMVAAVMAIGVLAAIATHRRLLRAGRTGGHARDPAIDDPAGGDSGPVVAARVDDAVAVAAMVAASDSAAALRQLREIAEGVHGVEALFDVNGRLIWISPSIERLTGRTPAECQAAPDALALLVHESDRKYCLRMAHRVAERGAGEDFEMRLVREDGRVCWVACHWRALGKDSAHPEGLRMSAEDIQARKETEYKLLETVTELRRAQALREHYLSRSNDERQRLSALLNVIRLGILFMDRDHRVLYYNRAMLDMWGFPPDENLIGVRDVVLQSRIADLLEQPELYFQHVQSVLQLHAVSEPHEIHFRNGRVVTDISAVVEGGQGRRGIGRVWIYEDVTDQRRIARRLVELAERDPLTDLFNRRRFHEELDRHLADAARRGVQVGLVALDLDGFKPINDAFGHQAGDEVLVGLAHGVGGIIRRTELFFRLGGDEFGVLVPDTSEEELSELARRIVEGIAALRFEFDGKQVGLTASLGISLYPRHACDAEELIGAADRAMYRSKNDGRNQWSIAGTGSESDRIPPSDSNEPNRRED
jgi:diguanylate cyclase (GGDEF)-like protein/PAS domain S-box-containing protein